MLADILQYPNVKQLLERLEISSVTLNEIITLTIYDFSENLTLLNAVQATIFVEIVIGLQEENKGSKECGRLLLKQNIQDGNHVQILKKTPTEERYIHNILLNTK